MILSIYRSPGLWWFRIFGWGVRWKRVSVYPLLFSERELKSGLKIGNWHFAWLTRSSSWESYSSRYTNIPMDEKALRF